MEKEYYWRFGSNYDWKGPLTLDGLKIDLIIDIANILKDNVCDVDDPDLPNVDGWGRQISKLANADLEEIIDYMKNGMGYELVERLC